MAEIEKIPWDESIWMFDVDDTLSDTSDISTKATIGIRNTLEPRFGVEVATQLQMFVNEQYDLLLAGNRIRTEADWEEVPGGKAAFDQLMAAITNHQPQVVATYGAPKKWSRELLLKLAADKLNVQLSAELIKEAVDAYWMELSNITQTYPDAMELLMVIKQHNRPVYLLTSSDARLQMQPDGTFTYDPAYSEALKRERIELLREKGIEYNVLSIGDPEDKPHKDFFEKGIRIAEADLGRSIDLKNVIMVGDQFPSDLKTPKEMGFGAVVLIDRTEPHFEVLDEHQVNTSDLTKIVEVLVQ